MLRNHEVWRPTGRPARHSFPKIVHLIWFPSTADVPPQFQGTPGKWRDLNPGWQVQTWNETQFVEFLTANYPVWLGEFLRINVNIKKADFARMVVMHHYGGVYVDYDIEPLRPLDDFLADDVVWGRLRISAGRLPRFLTAERISYGAYKLIISREYQRIDEHTGVANGMMIAQNGSELLRMFIEEHHKDHAKPVLQYMGPHALTRFLRHHYDRRETFILPPYYFLWERHHFKKQDPAGFVVATHGAQNSWGDHTKSDWWNV